MRPGAFLTLPNCFFAFRNPQPTLLMLRTDWTLDEVKALYHQPVLELVTALGKCWFTAPTNCG